MLALVDIARQADIPVPTLGKLRARGVIPQPEIKAGRIRLYSDRQVEAILHWLRFDYVCYKRHQRMEVS